MNCDCPILTRCCFCMPLRKGVLTFGYINLILSIIVVVIYSLVVHHASVSYNISHVLPAELTVALYCLEFLLTVVLIYGVHKRLVPCIRAFYYFAVTSTIAEILISIIEYANTPDQYGLAEFFIFTLGSFFLNLYLITLVRSLLRKLEMDGPNVYDNPLNQIVTGDKVEQSGTSNNATFKPVNL